MKNKKKEPTIIFQDKFTDTDFVEFVLSALEGLGIITADEFKEALTHGVELYPGLAALFIISPEKFYRDFVEFDDDGSWFEECLEEQLYMGRIVYFLRPEVLWTDFREVALSLNETKNSEPDGTTKSYKHLFEE
jgi:hypothetical protein